MRLPDIIIIMNTESLPSQLHIGYSSKVDVESLCSQIEELFPDAESIEYRDDTIYVYEADELIKFIHMSQDTIGIMFPTDVTSSAIVQTVWERIEPVFKLLRVTKFSKFDWKLKIVQPFKSKIERDLLSKKLSPIDGYMANSLTLYPENESGYSVSMDMVNKEKKEYGILLKFTYRQKNISKKDFLSEILAMEKDFINSDPASTVMNRITGESSR
jgi:hypothetical protein